MYLPLATLAVILAFSLPAIAEPSSFEGYNLTPSKIVACDIGMSREETAALLAQGPQPLRKAAELITASHAAEALPEEAINCVPRVMYHYLGPFPWRFIGKLVGENQEITVTINGMQRGTTIDPVLGRMTVWGIYGTRSDGRDFESIVGLKVPANRSRSLDPYRVDPVWRPRY